MATITLTTDTLISALMPSGGGSLASGDTIHLAGHSLIVDADAVSYPVTIANSGARANLELRDLGRIKLNATLPENVHPYIDQANPLPVAAEPGIDGDPYRTPLTANARAEIQLNGNFGLGGGAASLPTETRSGAFWAKAVSWIDSTHVQFDRDIDLHVGDLLQQVSYSGDFDRLQYAQVASYDNALFVAELDAELTRRTVGEAYARVAGGVCIFFSATQGQTLFTRPVFAGGICVVSPRSENQVQCYVTSSEISSSGLFCAFFTDTTAAYERMIRLCKNYATISTRMLVCGALVNAEGYAVTHSVSASIDEVAMPLLAWGPNQLCPEAISIRGGIINRAFEFSAFSDVFATGQYLKLSNVELTRGDGLVAYNKGAIRLHECAVGGIRHSSLQLLSGGTISGNYHAPATSSDITWRYTDRAVPVGATLRLRCAWMREGSAATRASVAVTSPATWWPSLWPLGAEALASVEFTGGALGWRQQLLSWRNTSTEVATVRVWECVTGTVAGGYLKAEEIKGGQL